MLIYGGRSGPKSASGFCPHWHHQYPPPTHQLPYLFYLSQPHSAPSLLSRYPCTGLICSSMHMSLSQHQLKSSAYLGLMLRQNTLWCFVAVCPVQICIPWHRSLIGLGPESSNLSFFQMILHFFDSTGPVCKPPKISHTQTYRYLSIRLLALMTSQQICKYPG